jgi:hypothetical protein
VHIVVPREGSRSLDFTRDDTAAPGGCRGGFDLVFSKSMCLADPKDCGDRKQPACLSLDAPGFQAIRKKVVPFSNFDFSKRKPCLLNCLWNLC